jgi:hypothetical protein
MYFKLALLVSKVRVQKQKSRAVVVAVTNPSTIQNSSNAFNQPASKKKKSGAKQNLVIATTRVVDDVDHRMIWLPSMREEFRKLGQMTF